jgi:hypothetical protein
MGNGFFLILKQFMPVLPVLMSHYPICRVDICLFPERAKRNNCS